MAERERAKAYTAFEISKNDSLMTWKMYWITFLACLGIAVIVTIAALFATSHDNIYIHEKFLESFFKAFVPFKMSVNFVGAHAPAADIRNILWADHPFLCLLPLVYFLASLAGACVLVFPLVIRYFDKKAEKLLEPVVVEGTEVLSIEQAKVKLKEEGPREKNSLPLCSLWLPKQYENYGLMINGSQGTGKSSATEAGIVAKQGIAKCIIHDPTGEFTEKFYVPGRDLLWNPLDKRCVPYNFYTDIQYITDIEALSGSYFPKTAKPDSNHGFFVNGSSDVFYGGVHIGFERGTKTMKWLWEFCAMSVADKRKILSESDAGARGLAALGTKDTPQSAGIQGTLMQYAKPLQWMQHLSGDFSLKGWLLDGKEGNLFISNKRDVRDTLIPILSCFIDRLGKQILSLPVDKTRRIWFFIDELGQLQKLPILPDLLTQGRKYGAAVVSIFQSIAQLTRIYGKDDTDDMLNCFSTTITFRCTDGTTAKYISQERIGDQTVQQKHVTQSYGLGENRDGGSVPVTEKTKAALIPATIMNLKNYEAYIKVPGGIVWKDKVSEQKNPARNEAFIMRPGLSMAEILADIAKLKSQTETAAAADPWGLKKKGKAEGNSKEQTKERPEPEEEQGYDQEQELGSL